MSDQPQVMVPDMCKTHQSLLVGQTGYGPNDTWRALILASQIALFQAATVRLHDKIGLSIEGVSKLGCLACQMPDEFGEIVEAGKSHELRQIKQLGESWVKDAASAQTEGSQS